MVWPIWVALTAFFSVLAFLTHQHRRAETLAVILIGLAFVQIGKSFLSGSALWIAACLVWLIVPVIIISIRTTISREVRIISALLVLSALCIPIGRMAGESYAFGSVALFFSDLFGASVVFYLGGACVVSAIGDALRRDRGLGRGSRTGLLGHHISGDQK